MHVELLECEEGRVGFRVGKDGLVPHQAGELGVKVQAVTEAFDYVVFGEVAAVAGEEAVVREGVEHGTGATDWDMLVLVVKGRVVRTCSR